MAQQSVRAAHVKKVATCPAQERDSEAPENSKGFIGCSFWFCFSLGAGAGSGSGCDSSFGVNAGSGAGFTSSSDPDFCFLILRSSFFTKSSAASKQTTEMLVPAKAIKSPINPSVDMVTFLFYMQILFGKRNICCIKLAIFI